MLQHRPTRTTCLVHVNGTGEVVWRKLSIGILERRCTSPLIDSRLRFLLDSTWDEDSTKRTNADKQRHKVAVSW